uniref:hypothetical protein n=1 Tax=Geobacillus sp. (strain Y412MC10) TaxID=481743 RepID=UPI001C92CB8D
EGVVRGVVFGAGGEWVDGRGCGVGVDVEVEEVKGGLLKKVWEVGEMRVKEEGERGGNVVGMKRVVGRLVWGRGWMVRMFFQVCMFGVVGGRG